MTAWDRFVDKPKLGRTDCILLIGGYFLTLIYLTRGVYRYFTWEYPGVVIMALYFFIVLSYRLYYWINTTYELTDSQLKIRSGFYKKDISLESITGVRFILYLRSRRDFTLPGKEPPLVKIRNKVLLIGPSVMITPENPAVFIEELRKRIPKLEVEGISSAYRSLNTDDLYKRLLDLYTIIYSSEPRTMLERNINAYVKQGFSREDAIRKLVEREFEDIPL